MLTKCSDRKNLELFLGSCQQVFADPVLDSVVTDL